MLSFYQQYWSVKIISNCCDTINGADIELIIVGCRFSLLAINGAVARGVVQQISVPFEHKHSVAYARSLNSRDMHKLCACAHHSARNFQITEK